LRKRSWTVSSPRSALESEPRLVGGAESVLGRRLSAGEAAGLERYISLLQTWQQVHRLVGSGDRQWIVDNIVLDSLLFSVFLPFSAGQVLDFGSGAGIPGIPLAITGRDLSFCLLEPRRRRASFLATAIRELALANARVLTLRSDEALRNEPTLHTAFDAVVGRCAGTVREMCRLSQAFLKPGGRLVLSGGPTLAAQIGDSRQQPSGTWQTVEHPTLRRSRTFFVAVGSG
jgi:16S rRNA (guanine527-N7)-methyltransferase